MAKTTINNGDTGLLVRTAINNNFSEVYDVTTAYQSASGSFASTASVGALSNVTTAYQSASGSFATVSSTDAKFAPLSSVPTGSVDNAVLRADGTGGNTTQTSGLIVDDAVVPYSVTGDAATDVITATGHIYATNQTVIFSAIAGGAGLAANTVYFVRNPSGNTFQLSTTSGGAAINFTTNITAGTVIAIQANVAILQNTTETNSALVLTPKGTGALIAGPKPDGTATGGNARGANAVDLQIIRSGGATPQTRVGSGANTFTAGTSNINAAPTGICIGASNTTSASGGNTPVAIGASNSATGWTSIAIGSGNNVTSTGAAFGFACRSLNNGSFGTGNETEATAVFSISSGYKSTADRYAMISHAAGNFSGNNFPPYADAQSARFVMRNKTTTNSAVELFLDGISTRLTIPSGKVLGLTINICGISSTGAAVAHYLRQYALKNVSGTTSEVYAPITIGTDNAAGTSIALSASDASDALIVSVTGTASTIWRWVASVDAVEIAFGT